MSYKPIIEIIENEYLITQLDRKRRIAALLPYDYYTSKKTYPVIYLHDGQNLFDDYAPFGNWGVDDTMEAMAKLDLANVIIIAIDHGGAKRIQEYLPFKTKKFTNDEGNLYLDFMMNDLKKIVDKNYRVRRERECTGIGGSSMGGLISLYAGFRYNEVFGKLLIFSPSLWISNEVFDLASKFVPKGKTDFYLYAGGKESENLVEQVTTLESLLRGQNRIYHNIRTKMSINPEGKHQEYFWGKEFPKALNWLINQD